MEIAIAYLGWVLYFVLVVIAPTKFLKFFFEAEKNELKMEIGGLKISSPKIPQEAASFSPLGKMIVMMIFVPSLGFGFIYLSPITLFVGRVMAFPVLQIYHWVRT